MKLARAEQIGVEIVARLEPVCERVMMAGSVRRQKAEVKDLEIVYISKIVRMPVDLFGNLGEYLLSDAVIRDLVDEGVLRWDDEVKRKGPKYQRLVHCASGLIVELFRAVEENWGAILTIRTGPGDFNRVLVDRIPGAMPMDMCQAKGFLWRRGVKVPVPEEEDYFREIGVPWWPPEERSAARLAKWLFERRLR